GDEEDECSDLRRADADEARGNRLARLPVGVVGGVYDIVRNADAKLEKRHRGANADRQIRRGAPDRGHSPADDAVQERRERVPEAEPHEERAAGARAPDTPSE